MEGTLRGALKRLGKDLSRRTLDMGSFMNYLMGLNRVQRLTDFSATQRPVLLIHGFATARRVLNILETRLRRDGYGVFSFRLGGALDTFNTGGMRAAARLVARKVERLSAKYDLPKLDVVAHSAGGLVARYWIKRLDGHRYVRTAVTLATPHHGTPAAYFGIATLGLVSRSVWQLAPMSGFIRKLKVDPFPETTRLISIYSPDDRLCPHPTCVLDVDQDNIKNIALPGLVHTDFLTKKKVYQLIREELEDNRRLEFPDYPTDGPTVIDSID